MNKLIHFLFFSKKSIAVGTFLTTEACKEAEVFFHFFVWYSIGIKE